MWKGHRLRPIPVPGHALDGNLAKAEPKKLRYRLLHVVARITHAARTTRLAIAEYWPWADALVTAFTRLAALPRSSG